MSIEDMLNKLNTDVENSPFDAILNTIIFNEAIKAIQIIQQYFNCEEQLAQKVYDAFKVKYGYLRKCNLSPEQIAYNNQVARELLNKPKCPTCSSTNIKKISTTAKIAGAATFGLFSKTAQSQFKCNNCGYKW